MQHNIYTFFSVYNCLDEEFDVPDAMADRDLCRAIAAGKMGLHPDGWGNHDPLSLRWLLRRRPEPLQERVYVSPADPVWEAKHRHRPVEEPKPEPKLKPWPRQRPKPLPVWPAWHPPPSAWSDPDGGFLNLTCDECRRNFGRTLHYPPGLRPSYVVLIRGLGRDRGWTCIVGRDRCPACSEVAPPQAKGNGAGTDQGDEQHA